MCKHYKFFSSKFVQGLSQIDEDIPTVHDTSNVKNSPSNIKDTNQGPLTRHRAKKLQEQVNSFLTNCAFMTSKVVILPKCSTLVVLRCTHEERAPDRTQKSIRSDRTTSSDHQKKQLQLLIPKRYEGPWVLVEKLIKPTFQPRKPHII